MTTDAGPELRREAAAAASLAGTVTEHLAQTGAEVRGRLIAARRRIVEELERFHGDVEDQGEPAPADALEVEEPVTETLAAIDAALGRLEAGCYGRCDVCRQPIAALRLEALPHAARCVRCQHQAENVVS